MNDKKVLKALSIIAAELYIQNKVSVLVGQGRKPGYAYIKDESLKHLAEHFKYYFEGSDTFSPGSIIGIDLLAPSE